MKVTEWWYLNDDFSINFFFKGVNLGLCKNSTKMKIHSPVQEDDGPLSENEKDSVDEFRALKSLIM